MVPPFEQSLMYLRTIYVQYLTILLSGFGKEAFQRFIKLCYVCYFGHNVGGANL